jgi:hypothetical protein
LVIDWRDTIYSNDPNINLFTELFEPTEEIGGVKVICEALGKIKYPEPIYTSRYFLDHSKEDYLIDKNRDLNYPTIIVKRGFSFDTLGKFFHTDDYTTFFKELRLRKRYWDDIQNFKKSNFNGKHMAGIHVRHGNREEEVHKKFEHRVIADIDRFMEKISSYLSKYKDSSSFFLATDSELVVEKFSDYFPDIIVRDQWRPDLDAGPVHKLSDLSPNGPIDNAANALIDMYLLSMCDVCIFTRGSLMLAIPYQLEKIYKRPRVEMLYDYKRHFEIGRFNPEKFYSYKYLYKKFKRIRKGVKYFKKTTLKSIRVVSKWNIKTIKRTYKWTIRTTKRTNKLLNKIIKKFLKLERNSIKYIKKRNKKVKKIIINKYKKRWRWLDLGNETLKNVNLKLLKILNNFQDKGEGKNVEFTYTRKFYYSIITFLLFLNNYIEWLIDLIRWQVVYKFFSNAGVIINHLNNFRPLKMYDKEGSLFKSSNNLLLGNYKKIFVIKMPIGGAGFFTYLLFVLNQLKYCEQNNFYPVVNFGKRSDKDPFFDPNYGDNMWDYFFEPVLDYTYAEIIKMVKDPNCPINEHDMTELEKIDLQYMHKHNAKSIFAYPYGFYKYKRSYDDKWYKRQRFKANKYIKKYIRIKENITQEVDDFYNINMKGNNVIGIHIRGTDKGTANAASNTMRIVKPSEYVKEIDKYLQEHKTSKIFVATDQEQSLEYMKSVYGEKIISYPSLRSKSNLAPFQMQEGNNYLKAKDVFIECLLLSRCEYLLKCTSAVGEAALWFNPELKSIDMNYIQ